MNCQSVRKLIMNGVGSSLMPKRPPAIAVRKTGDFEDEYDLFLSMCREQGYTPTKRLKALVIRDLKDSGLLPRLSVIAQSPGLATVFVSGSILTSRRCNARMLGL